jgi:hypothetical protein
MRIPEIGTPAGLPGVGIDVLDGGGQVLNVKHPRFGAKGDGTTDDTATIQAALDAAGQAGGATVYLPPGIYVAHALNVKSNTIVRGAGAQTLVRQRAGNYGHNGFGTLDVLDRSNVLICELAIDGNKSNVVTTNHLNVEGIDVVGGRNVHVRDVWVRNCHSDGIDWDGIDYGTATRVYVEDCDGWGVHISFQSRRVSTLACFALRCGLDHGRGGFDCWQEITNGLIHGCVAQECHIGFELRGPGNTISDCRAIDSVANGLHIFDRQNNVVNFRTTNSGGAGILLDGTAALDNRLIGVRVDGTQSGPGIYVSASRNQILSPLILNPATHGIEVAAAAQHTVINTAEVRAQGGERLRDEGTDTVLDGTTFASTSNGHYSWHRGTGSMRCWHELATDGSGVIAWTFPRPFSPDRPEDVGATALGTTGVQVSISNRSASGMTVRTYNADGDPLGNVPVSAFAQGRRAVGTYHLR